MATIAFVAFMAFLIKFSEERWWLVWFMIMGVAVQCGYKAGIVGIAVSMGMSKVLKDICQAR
ncbi:MAG: hypothetical protein ACYDHC_02900 [Desulfuromonadaceae bacterium]